MFLGRSGAKVLFVEVHEVVFHVFPLRFQRCKGAKECKSDRSRQAPSNEYLVANFGFDTSENEPSEVCQKGVR